MRRLLAAFATIGVMLGLAAPALAGGGRVPAGVKYVSIRLTAPTGVSGSHKPVSRTLTSAAKVRAAVRAADALQIAHRHGMCPMFIRLGPVLTVTFRAGPAGPALARAQVEVAWGKHGSSGSSFCFPIHFTSSALSGGGQALVGNGFVRAIGRLIGTAIS